MPLTDAEKSKYGAAALQAIIAKGEAKDADAYRERMGLTDSALKKLIESDGEAGCKFLTQNFRELVAYLFTQENAFQLLDLVCERYFAFVQILMEYPDVLSKVHNSGEHKREPTDLIGDFIKYLSREYNFYGYREHCLSVINDCVSTKKLPRKLFPYTAVGVERQVDEFIRDGLLWAAFEANKLAFSFSKIAGQEPVSTRALRVYHSNLIKLYFLIPNNQKALGESTQEHQNKLQNLREQIEGVFSAKSAPHEDLQFYFDAFNLLQKDGLKFKNSCVAELYGNVVFQALTEPQSNSQRERIIASYPKRLLSELNGVWKSEILLPVAAKILEAPMIKISERYNTALQIVKAAIECYPLVEENCRDLEVLQKAFFLKQQMKANADLLLQRYQTLKATTPQAHVAAFEAMADMLKQNSVSAAESKSAAVEAKAGGAGAAAEGKEAKSGASAQFGLGLKRKRPEAEDPDPSEPARQVPKPADGVRLERSPGPG